MTLMLLLLPRAAASTAALSLCRRASAQRRHTLTCALPSLQLLLQLDPMAVTPATLASTLAAAAARARRTLLIPLLIPLHCLPLTKG